MVFRHSPALRLLFPFTAGIICGYFLHLNDFISVFTSEIILIILLIFLPGRLQSKRAALICNLLIYIIVFEGGLLSLQFARAVPQPYNAAFYIVRLRKPPELRERTAICDAGILYCMEGGKWKAAQGKLRILFNRNGFKGHYGDYFVLNGNPERIAEPLNPGEFDYAAYLARRNIYYQLYADSTSYKKAGMNSTSFIYRTSWELRDYLIEILRKELKDEDISGVAAALLAGYEEDISAGLMNSYAATGTLHVLSVSGMHVALIYKVLEMAFSFLLKRRYGRHIYFLLIILLVWFYSLLTGMSPSVLRAAMMLSFVIMGKWLGRTSTVYNSMFVSCLFLLLFQPQLIFETGFQLSVLAVGGIVFIHPLLFRVWTPPGKILYAAWSIISVSIAATLLTFPISLFYFHQFPNLFLLSNIIIIPATTLAIYGCIALVILYNIPIAGLISAKIVYGSIWFSNTVAAVIEKIPFAVTNNISISVYEVYFLYLIIIVFVVYLVRRNFASLRNLLLLLVLFLLLQISENYCLSSSRQVMIFAIKNHSMIVFREGKSAYMIKLQHDSLPGLYFHTRSYLLQQGIDAGSIVELDTVSNYSFGNYIYLKTIPAGTSKKQVMLVNKDNIYNTINLLKRDLIPGRLIVDGSVKGKAKNNLLKIADQKDTEVTDVMKEDAFIVSF